VRLAGCFTAIATPFRNGNVDIESLAKIVEHQIEGGVAGIVPCGTTGEASTLTSKEYDDVVKRVVEFAAGRVPVFPGTGSNSTAAAVEKTRHAREAGASGALVVTPYYNKPTQEGLFRHFEAIAKAVPGFPIILYEIPGRTAVSIDVETCARLCVYNNIVAIKEASGKLERVTKLRQLTDLAVLSGDDASTLPIMALGGTGVVSVASNLVPADVCALVAAAAEGETQEALRMNDRLDDFFRALFLETNPAPVKYALHRAGIFASDEVRLPLVTVGDKTRKEMDAAMAKLGFGTGVAR